MKKILIAALLLVGLTAAYYVIQTRRCKSLSKMAESRIHYSFKDGCYLDVLGKKVPLK